MILFDKVGETPLDDISGLKIEGITTRSELDEAEAEYIRALQEADHGNYDYLKRFMFPI
jgi:hypothetical protein